MKDEDDIPIEFKEVIKISLDGEKRLIYIPEDRIWMLEDDEELYTLLEDDGKTMTDMPELELEKHKETVRAFLEKRY